MAEGLFKNSQGELPGNPKMQGNIGMAYGIAYFTKEGYTVSIPLTDGQDYDFLAEDNKTNRIFRIQAKTTRYKRDLVYESSLIVSGGNRSGRGSYRLIGKSNVDLVYILCDDGTQYLIPIDVISGQKSIKLGIEYARFRV
jgi:hypothetical protein